MTYTAQTQSTRKQFRGCSLHDSRDATCAAAPLDRPSLGLMKVDRLSISDVAGERTADIQNGTIGSLLNFEHSNYSSTADRIV